MSQRCGVRPVLAGFLFLLVSAGVSAQTLQFDIPAGDLGSALDRYIQKTGVQLIYRADQLQHVPTTGLSGDYTAEEALSRLLEGTDYVVTRDASGAMAVANTHDLRRLEEEKRDTNGAALDAAVPTVSSATSAIESARQIGIEEIIVTGQKREERIQDVPIAISAFSMENLDNQKIEGGFDLLKAVPNVTFSKSNFSGYNFQIRGIGTQAISATTDPGVAVSFNNTTLIVNRLFEQEYLDIERVEVLRGPQGTLFGRNATAGVINVITAKPELGYLGGEIKLETGNYNAQRFRGHVNIPVGETAALRGAFAMTKRDGYGTNLAASDPDIQDFLRNNNRAPISDNIDNRDLWTGRLSIGWQPTDSFKANLTYERFEEDDRRMRSTKQLCHHADGSVLLSDQAMNGNLVRAGDFAREIRPMEPEYQIRVNYLGQLSQGCLPGSLYDKGDPIANRHGAYGTPNGNTMPFIRVARGGSFNIGAAAFPHDPECPYVNEGIISMGCATDPLAMLHGQSRDMRAIFSLIDPGYRATSEIVELSLEFQISDDLTLASQSVVNRNELFSTQDFLRFKTQPAFNDSRFADMNGSISIAHRRGVSPKGVFTDPQLGPSDRLLMQDVSQQDARQFSQEFRLLSDFDGRLNFSVGANYTRFETVTDYFVFINMLTALVYGGDVYSGIPQTFPSMGINQKGLWGTPMVTNDMTVGCGIYMSQVETDIFNNEIATCIYVQKESIDDVVGNPQGHNFFLSRNPYSLDSSSIFGEIYYSFSEELKLTAGLRMNWDRKVFTPVPSQTLLADWRGRLSGGTLFDSPAAFDASKSMQALCLPRSPDRIPFTLKSAPCALSGLAEYGRGYPSLPDLVQEWRVPTGRIGLDWKLNSDRLNSLDEALLYGFYTRGYKAGGANPPTQSSPSGLLLQAAQGAAAPPVFEAEYVNAVELGLKTRWFGGGLTLNASSFYYDYSDYQISKIVDRTAVNENVDAAVWGLELETVLAPVPDMMFNASIGYLRTRIADGERSLDLMDRTQGGNQHYVDPAWASVDCASSSPSHIACQRKPRLDASGNPVVINGQPVYEQQLDANGDPILDANGQPLPVYLYRNGFDQWVVVRPTITQASSCVAPAALVYQDILAMKTAGSAATLSGDLLSKYCPAGQLLSEGSGWLGYSQFTSAPNAGAGFLADVGGNELPNAPRFTVSLGAQKTVWLGSGDWSATGRVDWYWQAKSFHRMYNTEYDRLNAWSSTNLSFWVESDRLGLVVEAYVKNIFDETPITGAFMNSDDTGLSTNIFTLDPRLIGLSVKKRF